ncbi:hypothetical protein SAMN05192540_2866 [Maribacter dokdonensis]|uniref:Uncharacterized protein n=1 Tax=Maribacter dokdonensis TaxID=320912 RepID=A0A1H4RH90_9FLAO|nr:hypothetical protein [Maribacter dokdonensis]SEC31267.1 hypothetical protein SAMN05192540_2866 [Maribacter dokdonensis]
MKEAIIKEIVEKVFEKAKTECPKHSRYALSNHIAEFTSISAKTIERLYDKYLEKRGSIGDQNEYTINDLCKYLGYNSYADYVKQNRKSKISINVNNGGEKKKWKVLVTVCLVLVIGLILGLSEKSKEPKCMVWQTDHYERIECFTINNKIIIPLDEVRLQNFKKVDVDLTTEFFEETTGKPLIWYYKNGNTIEFYTSPGLHPVNDKTLKAVTEHIIEKYVPLHTYEESSFAE